jgi:hypothetical protein
MNVNVRDRPVRTVKPYVYTQYCVLASNICIITAETIIYSCIQ